MKDFSDKLRAMNGKKYDIKCLYHGTANVYLDAVILGENESALEIAVSLPPHGITSFKYDSKRKALDIWSGLGYTRGPTKAHGIELAQFETGLDLKEIHVYDEGQKIS